MSFWIQTSNPKMLAELDEEDETVCDAMQTVFPMQTEEAFMVWNRVHIPISYKYTVGFLLGQAVRMIEELTREDTGTLTIQWPSNDFHATWHMSWNDDQLKIQSEWVSVVGFTEKLLEERSILVTDRSDFIAEWKKLLGVALAALTQAGYTDAHLVDIEKIKKTHDSIRQFGMLYR